MEVLAKRNRTEFDNYKNFCKFFEIKETDSESLKAYFTFKELAKKFS